RYRFLGLGGVEEEELFALVSLQVLYLYINSPMNQPRSLCLVLFASMGPVREEPDDLREEELKHLQRCLELAEEALKAGDQPFGSVLVDENNKVLAEARNRVNELSHLAHPEIELTHWAAENLTAAQRKKTVMYTSGEHCPMCATAHGWLGLGKIVYIHSAAQLGAWLQEWEVPPPPVSFYPVNKLVPGIAVKGPVPQLLERIRELHRRYYASL